ncbi:MULTISPECIES: hypothetical protein [Acidithiobacillus]|jgi:hypothetical protein|uniref:hypothetical protein n=1 Tax=Acidithiobacillus TaxID=119977 RepID=UPI001C06CE8F|nr:MULTISPECIES: hypothetical protein [Acidithiobacillus]MBU2749874.1 hypothetical protein [Acidithiobacillus thiooxidans]MBU2836871.1 hypothetical protein [Acidithiobacillus thiooxidans]MBU2850765.1 hypothetical protein [Acidithiobacillus ferrivorans]
MIALSRYCAKCSLPHYSASDTCPRCRVQERTDWYQPSVLVQDLLDQIGAIVDDHVWGSRNVMQLEVWLKDARRLAAGLGPS